MGKQVLQVFKWGITIKVRTIKQMKSNVKELICLPNSDRNDWIKECNILYNSTEITKRIYKNISDEKIKIYRSQTMYQGQIHITIDLVKYRETEIVKRLTFLVNKKYCAEFQKPQEWKTSYMRSVHWKRNKHDSNFFRIFNINSNIKCLSGKIQHTQERQMKWLLWKSN